MVSNTRLYGGSISLVSGFYSIASATTGVEMTASGWFMLVLGVVVVVHGVTLIAATSPTLDEWSGELMVGYALVMLLNQALGAAGFFHGNGTDDDMMMNGGMNGGMGADMTAGMGWDAGMASLALLMLVSGLIMLRDDGMMNGGTMNEEGMNGGGTNESSDRMGN